MPRALAIVAGVLLVAALALVIPRRALAAGSAVSDYDSLYQRHGAQLGLDWRLLKAVAQVESSENPAAVNTADNESIGLMQVLCRPDGRGGCANALNVEGWAGITRAALFDPDTNIWIGAQILAWNVQQFGVLKGVAVYNAWDQRNAPPAGPFKNQGYVERVRAAARALGLNL